MFEISHKDLLQAPLHVALKRLMNVPGETSAVFNLLRIQRKFKIAMNEASELHDALTKEFIVVEDGKPKAHAHPTSLMPYQIKEGMESAFEAKIDEFLSMKVKIESYKVDLSDFPSFKPTAVELEAMSPLMEEVPEVPHQ